MLCSLWPCSQLIFVIVMQLVALPLHQLLQQLSVSFRLEYSSATMMNSCSDDFHWKFNICTVLWLQPAEWVWKVVRHLFSVVFGNVCKIAKRVFGSVSCGGRKYRGSVALIDFGFVDPDACFQQDTYSSRSVIFAVAEKGIEQGPCD